MITLGNVIHTLKTKDVIVQSYVYNSKNHKYWKIIKPLTIELSNGQVIKIPEGFEYDMATVPKWLWSIVRPFNDALIGTLIHDYLYIHKEAHNMTRREVDEEYFLWNTFTNNNKLDNYLRWIFVRLFGWILWYGI